MLFLKSRLHWMESSEEDFSDYDIANIFGESEGEDDFGGFNFSLPDNIN